MVDKEQVYQETGARCYYNTLRKRWCALWLSNGFEHKLWYNPKTIDTKTLIQEIHIRSINDTN